MLACLDLKFHRELKLLIYLKALSEKPFANILLLLEELIRENKILNTILCYFKS
jgi:hypothetical protein